MLRYQFACSRRPLAALAAIGCRDLIFVHWLRAGRDLPVTHRFDNKSEHSYTLYLWHHAQRMPNVSVTGSPNTVSCLFYVTLRGWSSLNLDLFLWGTGSSTHHCLQQAFHNYWRPCISDLTSFPFLLGICAIISRCRSLWMFGTTIQSNQTSRHYQPISPRKYI